MTKELEISLDRKRVAPNQSIPLTRMVQDVVNHYESQIVNLEVVVRVKGDRLDKDLGWDISILDLLYFVLEGGIDFSLSFGEAQVVLKEAIDKLSKLKRKNSEYVCEKLADLFSAHYVLSGSSDSDHVSHFIENMISPKDYKKRLLNLSR